MGQVVVDGSRLPCQRLSFKVGLQYRIVWVLCACLCASTIYVLHFGNIFVALLTGSSWTCQARADFSRATTDHTRPAYRHTKPPNGARAAERAMRRQTPGRQTQGLSVHATLASFLAGAAIRIVYTQVLPLCTVSYLLLERRLEPVQKCHCASPPLSLPRNLRLCALRAGAGGRHGEEQDQGPGG